MDITSYIAERSLTRQGMEKFTFIWDGDVVVLNYDFLVANHKILSPHDEKELNEIYRWVNKHPYLFEEEEN